MSAPGGYPLLSTAICRLMPLKRLPPSMPDTECGSPVRTLRLSMTVMEGKTGCSKDRWFSFRVIWCNIVHQYFVTLVNIPELPGPAFHKFSESMLQTACHTRPLGKSYQMSRIHGHFWAFGSVTYLGMLLRQKPKIAPRLRPSAG